MYVYMCVRICIMHTCVCVFVSCVHVCAYLYHVYMWCVLGCVGMRESGVQTESQGQTETLFLCTLDTHAMPLFSVFPFPGPAATCLAQTTITFCFGYWESHSWSPFSQSPTSETFHAQNTNTAVAASLPASEATPSPRPMEK